MITEQFSLSPMYNYCRKSILLLSSLEAETESSKILEHIKTCLRYLSSFHVTEVDEKLFQWIMPAIKNTLQKAIDDNFLLSDTCEDDFVLNILKQNLGLLLEFIHILKEVLDFFAAKDKICLVDIKYTAITSIQIISSTYDHCRNSSETYKVNFNEDLLEIFKVMQEVHSMYLQIFDTTIVVSEALEDDTEKKICYKTIYAQLARICFYLNVKLLATNWKGYIGIAQKFLDILKDQLDLTKPIGCLASIIYDNLSSLNDPETIDPSTQQIIKLTGFLIKVILKLLDIFWDYKEKNVDMIMEFCCSIYSFTSHRFSMLEYPFEIIQLIDDSIFAHMKPFVWKFMQEEQFLQVKNSFKEFFWPENNFDDLVVHIGAAVITHDMFYAKVEIILLENILQEEIWAYFLATEIWCLVLRSLDCTSKLIVSMFEPKFAAARTKTEAIVKNVLAQEAQFQLEIDLLRANFVSITIDSSNHREIKVVPLMILNQLALLSSNDCFKIHVCFSLQSFSHVNKNKLGQDSRRMFGTIVTILSNLLNSNNVVKYTVLELLETLVQNGKEEIVKNTLMNCGNDIVELVSTFLRKNVEKQKFNTEYFKFIGELKYRHNCVMRTHTHTAKKIKLDIDVPHQNRDDYPIRESLQNVDPIQVKNNIIEEQTSTHAVKLRDYKHRSKSKKDPAVVAVEESKENEDDSIDEVLCRIKGEIKCLTKVLKTEKLSSKNVSDLKYITNQLSSLM
ncbi:unnamed protein product [Diabrotica balteata]|uniref:Uncharacterized protein n=1 Tax=Diabrotica balteata TaxID=107213 RepID=A0A9N9X9B7_DIABA|nr:unnamed protein product [Diabrotica balteata]